VARTVATCGGNEAMHCNADLTATRAMYSLQPLLLRSTSPTRQRCQMPPWPFQDNDTNVMGLHGSHASPGAAQVRTHSLHPREVALSISIMRTWRCTDHLHLHVEKMLLSLGLQRFALTCAPSSGIPLPFATSLSCASMTRPSNTALTSMHERRLENKTDEGPAEEAFRSCVLWHSSDAICDLPHKVCQKYLREMILRTILYEMCRILQQRNARGHLNR
jgi:hypothetical protein